MAVWSCFSNIPDRYSVFEHFYWPRSKQMLMGKYADGGGGTGESSILFLWPDGFLVCIFERVSRRETLFKGGLCGILADMRVNDVDTAMWPSACHKERAYE